MLLTKSEREREKNKREENNRTRNHNNNNEIDHNGRLCDRFTFYFLFLIISTIFRITID